MEEDAAGVGSDFLKCNEVLQKVDGDTVCQVARYLASE